VQRDDDLRQLDDWVFDLSGEAQARRQGLGGGFDGLAMLMQGARTRRHRHPTPHKGILVFNGPVGTPLSQRTITCLHSNDLAFVQTRNFCIISLAKLMESVQNIQANTLAPGNFWDSLHATAGEF